MIFLVTQMSFTVLKDTLIDKCLYAILLIYKNNMKFANNDGILVEFRSRFLRIYYFLKETMITLLFSRGTDMVLEKRHIAETNSMQRTTNTLTFSLNTSTDSILKQTNLF